MAMHVQSGEDDENPDLNTTINTTPLVDVMLVLLIIFLVTIPVIVKVVPVQLPNARNIVTQTKPENIVIAVTADGDVYYNNMPVDQTELKEQLRASLIRGLYARKIPEVHIRGDKEARFQAIGRVILACQEIGIPKVGFLTEPRNEAS